MDLYILFFLIIVLPILLIGAIIFLSFWIPKKLGYPKVGKIIAGILCLFFTYQAFMIVFEDELFSKEDAIELLEEQDLFLKHDFKIDNNKFSSAIGEYYHTFTLSISEKDKNRLIEEILSATDFKGTDTEELLYSSIDKYNGPKVSQNYETELYYVREYLEPNGAGYAPIFRKISISKKENKIKFEDIDD